MCKAPCGTPRKGFDSAHAPGHGKPGPWGTRDTWRPLYNPYSNNNKINYKKKQCNWKVLDTHAISACHLASYIEHKVEDQMMNKLEKWKRMKHTCHDQGPLQRSARSAMRLSAVDVTPLCWPIRDIMHTHTKLDVKNSDAVIVKGHKRLRQHVLQYPLMELP